MFRNCIFALATAVLLKIAVPDARGLPNLEAQGGIAATTLRTLLLQLRAPNAAILPLYAVLFLGAVVILRLLARQQIALALFGSLPVDADYSVKQLCSYYSAVSKFYFGQALYNASLSDSSYQVLKSLENDFLKIHAAIYPIDCNTGESFYRIYRSDFEPINADYNLLMGLLTQQNDNTPGHHIALKYFNNVMINDYASPWAKYRSADFIMRNSLQTSGYKPEAAPAIIDFIKASCWLDESAMQKASGLNYENALNGLQALDSIYKPYPADAARDHRAELGQ